MAEWRGSLESLPPRCPRAAVGTRWKSDHIWLCLLALGLRRECHPHVELGRNMFAKPNRRAFVVVFHFLFAKLDKYRAEQTFRGAAFGKGASHSCRRMCCLWLREIAKQVGRGFPCITPSTLICPGGPKFIHVVYCFARYVMTEDMKKLSVDAGIPFAEAVVRRPEDIYILNARHRVSYNKLLQTLQRKDFVNQEYRKKARVLIREIKKTKSEYRVMQKQSCRMKQNDRNKNDTTERIQKVRSMWTLTVEMLTSLKKDKEVVDSVLEDCAHPCILDGTDVVLNVPRLLVRTVESGIYGFCTDNLYEDGKLNFLTVIQLLNEALSVLRDEHCPCELKGLHRIEDVVKSYKKALQDLNTSLRREQRHCEQRLQSVSREQEVWGGKWKMILDQCPYNLISEDDLEPASGSSDEDEDNTVIYLFSDGGDSLHEEHHGKDGGALETMMDTRDCVFVQHEDSSVWEATDSLVLFSSCLRRSSLPFFSDTSEEGDLLISLHTETCVGNKKPLPPKILKNGKEEFPTSEMEESAGEDVIQAKSLVKKDNLLEKARDRLAEEVAKSVMSESPNSGEEKGMALDYLISSLSFNPFLTRKQIPRTPENLLTEIRSSWRKAIQTEGSLDIELSPAEVVTEESSMSTTPSMQEEVDSTHVRSKPPFPVSDLDPPVSEKKSQLSSMESSPQEHVSLGHNFESSDSKLSGIQESERTESEELDCSASSGSSAEDLSQSLQNVGKSMNIPDTCLKSGSRTNTLPSDHSGSCLMDEMLSWNVTWLNSVSHEATNLGILHETLPESDIIDLNLSAGSDSFFYTKDSVNITDGSEGANIEKSDLDIQSPSNSHEVLKRTASESEEELYQTCYENKFESCGAERSPIVEDEKENDDDSSMDEEFTKMPLPNSRNESKYSVSSLLVSVNQQVAKIAAMVHEVPLDLVCQLKNKNS